MRFVPAVTVGILLGMSLILPACGEGGTKAAGRETASTSDAKSPPSGAKAKTPLAARRCGKLLGDFFDSMESLSNTLAVGLSYDDYLNAVNHVRATYASVEADHLPIGCLAGVGIPAERALNIYIDAANTWGDCLATASCDLEAVEPKLQDKWVEASDLLSSAQSGLRGLG